MGDGFGQVGAYTPDVGHIRVSDMLGYSSGSMALKVGWGATSHKIRDVAYERIDIVNNKQINHGTLIGVNPRITHQGKPAVVANFTYSDIWYEHQNINIGIPVSFA